MKHILILSILCLVTVARGDTQNHAEECARELNIKDFEKYRNIKLDELLLNPTEEATCMIACDRRKSANANGITLYKDFLLVVHRAYENGFDSANFSREDAESKIDNCFLQERVECEFFKCVDPFHSPFADLFIYDLISAIGGAILESIFTAIGDSISS